MWLYLPNVSPSSTPALALECSAKRSCSGSKHSGCRGGLSVTSSGTPQQRPLWWPGWKSRPWIMRLSATRCDPSTLARGVESWTSHVRACRASRTASLAKGPATPIDGAGAPRITASAPAGRLRNFCESCATCDPPWFSSKTFQPGLWGDTSDQLARSYADWVTRSKIRSSSLRATLARRMSESVYSSWATCPQAWHSESAMLGGSSSRGGDRIGEELLGGQIRNWPSARAEDSESCGNHPNATDSLTGATKLWPPALAWPTPAARDAKGPNAEAHRESRERPHEDQLPNRVATWATPNMPSRVPETAASKATRPNSGGIDLQTQAISWATPLAKDGRGEMTLSAKKAARAKGAPKELLHEAGAFPYSPRAEAMKQTPTTPTGALGRLLQSWTPPSCRALNPNFQWWLMGWPSPVRIYCASAATEWSRWRRLVLSQLCFLLRSEAGNE